MSEIVPPSQPPAEEPDTGTGTDTEADADTDRDNLSDDERALVASTGESEVAGFGETLRDVGSRLPAYARLSQGLVAAGLLSGNQQAEFLGPLGLGPLARVSRFVPLLNQLTRIVTLVGAIRFALTQLDPEVAAEHLAQAGLSREQVEADFQATRGLAERAAEAGSQQATRALEVGSEVGTRALAAGREQIARAVEVAAPVANEKLHQGAKRAGRLAGLGVRAFRDWQSKSNER